MEVTWLGHSCFRIKGKDAVLVTDPYDNSIGNLSPKLTANIITVSHNHPGHNYTGGVGGTAKVFKGPGEYEMLDIFINGLPSHHDAENGTVRGKNTIYIIRMEEVHFCHLGDLGHLLSPNFVQSMGTIDVLFLPVGGVSTINASLAAQVVRTLSPRIVVPMHYKTEKVIRLEPVDNFLKEVGSLDKPRQPKLMVTRANLPPELQVVVLESAI